VTEGAATHNIDSSGKTSMMPLHDDIELQDALWELTSQYLGLDMT